MDDRQPFEPRGTIIIPGRFLRFDIKHIPCLEYRDESNPYDIQGHLLHSETEHIQKTKYGLGQGYTFLKPFDRIFIVPKEAEKNITDRFGKPAETQGGNVKQNIYTARAPLNFSNRNTVDSYLNQIIAKYVAFGLDEKEEKEMMKNHLTIENNYLIAKTMIIYNSDFIKDNKELMYKPKEIHNSLVTKTAQG